MRGFDNLCTIVGEISISDVYFYPYFTGLQGGGLIIVDVKFNVNHLVINISDLY